MAGRKGHIRIQLSTAAIVLLSPSLADAHSFARYVSTPITPPEELLWVLPVYVALFISGNLWFRRRWADSELGRSVRLAVGFLVCFAGSFFLIGSFAADMTTRPPPGLGTPHPTYWGFSWDDVGGLFVRWNIYGMIALIVWSLVFLRPGFRKNRLRWLALFGNVVLYSVCTLPYVATGAWVHGWAGAHVFLDCQERLDVLNAAAVDYAKAHAGRFPSVDGIEELLETVRPRLPDDSRYPEVSLTTCPLGAARDREPERYNWHDKFSGARLRAMDPDRMIREGDLPITCPYHDRQRGFAAFKLKERILDAREAETPSESGPRGGP